MTWNCCGGPRSPFPEGPSRPEVQTSDKKAIKVRSGEHKLASVDCTFSGMRCHDRTQCMQYNKRRLKWSLKENNGRLFLEGLALVADIPTVNRRIYTREILGPALKRCASHLCLYHPYCTTEER